MRTNPRNPLLFIFAIALVIHTTSNSSIHAALSGLTSCTQLPFPGACSQLPGSSLAPGGDFRRSVILGAMQRVQQAYVAGMATPGADSSDRLFLAAWADCIELFEGMTVRLQRALNSPANDDSQTWLSATLADLETCRNGFHDFGYDLDTSSCPFTSRQYNVSYFLCNCLAANKGSYVPPPSSSPQSAGRRLLREPAFPDWLSAADRRLLQLPSPKVNASIVVAQDGSGNYRTISEAVAALSSIRNGTARFVIYVKAGVYKENVQVPTSAVNLALVGDGINATVVTGSRNVVDGSTTFQSATFAVVGDGFIARDMTFENTAGPQKHQAVALRSGADLSVFYRCSFKGYQDTLYTHSLRQFYRECDIYGTVDFIFGDAAVVFQNCTIYLRRPMPGQSNTVTAQGRMDVNENTGTSIHNSRVVAGVDYLPVQKTIKSYLGRPWKKYSRTVFMKTFMDSSIVPAGWLPWSGNFALSTLYYREYQNTGPGANTSGRVTWPGYRVITNASEAARFTVGNFISGASWLPATGVPFTSGL